MVYIFDISNYGFLILEKIHEMKYHKGLRHQVAMEELEN